MRYFSSRWFANSLSNSTMSSSSLCSFSRSARGVTELLERRGDAEPVARLRANVAGGRCDGGADGATALLLPTWPSGRPPPCGTEKACSLPPPGARGSPLLPAAPAARAPDPSGAAMAPPALPSLCGSQMLWTGQSGVQPSGGITRASACARRVAPACGQLQPPVTRLTRHGTSRSTGPLAHTARKRAETYPRRPGRVRRVGAQLPAQKLVCGAEGHLAPVAATLLLPCAPGPK